MNIKPYYSRGLGIYSCVLGSVAVATGFSALLLGGILGGGWFALLLSTPCLLIVAMGMLLIDDGIKNLKNYPRANKTHVVTADKTEAPQTNSLNKFIQQNAVTTKTNVVATKKQENIVQRLFSFFYLGRSDQTVKEHTFQPNSSPSVSL